MKMIETPYSKNNPGHYSPAVEHDGILYISGQLSIDPKTGAVPEGGIRAEAAQALENLDTVLKAAGVGRGQVLMCRVYTPDIAYWPEVNEVYQEFFGSHKPARAVVPTNPLHHGCLVEIEAVACMDGGISQVPANEPKREWDSVPANEPKRESDPMPANEAERELDAVPANEPEQEGNGKSSSMPDKGQEG